MSGEPSGKRPQGSLPLEAVSRLVALLRESGVGEIQVRQGELEISVKAMPEAPGPRPASEAEAPSMEPPVEAVSPEADGFHAVRSPLVGTFYRAPAPGEEPYVEVGDTVKAGQPLCIVEAMKLMNEVATSEGGRVVEIAVSNGEAVEFEQVLMYLEPVED